MNPESGRVGMFFIFIGLVLVILFAGSGSDSGEGLQMSFFFLSLVAFLLAFFLIRRAWKAPGESARFRTFRSLTRKKPGKQQERK